MTLQVLPPCLCQQQHLSAVIDFGSAFLSESLVFLCALALRAQCCHEPGKLQACCLLFYLSEKGNVAETFVDCHGMPNGIFINRCG